MTLEELKDILRSFGVAGAGGAGFPSYAKLSEKADTIILNCAECEPLLKLHRQVMRTFAQEIMSALELVCDAVGAKRAIIAIKPSYKRTVAAIEGLLKEFNKISIGLLPEVYPAGDEVVTIYETTGRVVAPGKLPISVGVTVFNVETMLNIYNAVNESKGVTHKYITVTGEVKSPVTLRVPIGITVGELLNLAGGTTIPEYTLISGGPMMGNIVGESDIVTKTTNAILVLPNNHPVVLKRKNNTKISIKRAMSACCQCRMCTDLCPRNLLGHPIESHAFMRSLTTGVTADINPYIGTYFCTSCGLCEMYSCFQNLSPRTLITAMKNDMRKKGIPMPDITESEAKEVRKGRYVLKSRLTARLGLTKYNHPATLEDREYKPKKVKLLLSQHIGAPAVPIVQKGDKVEENQLIAAPKADALSVGIHSSIRGTVTAVTDKYIIVSAAK